jgi:crossover junction endodeoxyribonuclease RuvC
MRILGIDPGLNCTGYGLVAHDPPSARLVEGGVIRTDASASLEVRLATIAQGIRGVLSDLDPDVMVVEDLYAKYEHPQTAILMGHARGVILLAAAERGLEVAAYPASLVKRSLTGHGRATKEQVASMVVHVLGLTQTPEPRDVTDALALCLCHAAPMRLEGCRGALPERLAQALADQGAVLHRGKG